MTSVRRLSFSVTGVAGRATCSRVLTTMNRYRAMPTTTKAAVVKNSERWSASGSWTFPWIWGAMTKAMARTLNAAPYMRKVANLLRSTGTWVIVGAMDPYAMLTSV